MSSPGLAVVGESYHEESFERIFGPKTEDGVDVERPAVVRPVDDNPYDANAVQVEIEGHLVGHLSREDAKAYRERWGTEAYSCTASVRGGWDRGGGDEGGYGVRLDLPLYAPTGEEWVAPTVSPSRPSPSPHRQVVVAVIIALLVGLFLGLLL